MNNFVVDYVFQSFDIRKSRPFFQRSTSSEKPHGHLVMRVRREPEIGSDGGDVEIYDDGDHDTDDEEKIPNPCKSSDSESLNPLIPASLTNKRFIHERAIFQELTHLKRMQIQYGKVVIARREVNALYRNLKIRPATGQKVKHVL